MKQALRRVIWDQDVRGTPTFRIYKNGRVLRAFSGLQDDELKAEIDECLDAGRLAKITKQCRAITGQRQG